MPSVRILLVLVPALAASLPLLGCSSTSPETTSTIPPAATPCHCPGPTPEPTPAPCGGTEADIIDLDLRGEAAVIRGSGSMYDWHLRSVVGDQWYAFPASFLLDDQVSVRSGPDPCAPSATVLCWTTAEIWDDSGDAAELYDCEGRLVDTLDRY